ncbi:sodium:proton antiporter [Mucilaginibacter galii]|uniref:Cation transporter n=1 Tax=Mucilaginibacter galii TaxID=2005073 RepID=A0A917J9P2_9SPHI|nr:sodium:proton antiporter [Mucilaginibacter galii]GGI51159.1 cation transporter [Mucilaginibacter galii]
MDQYIVIISVIGIAALGMAWMPAFTKRTGVSYAILYTLGGMLIYLLFPHLLPAANPKTNLTYTGHLTELVVIISLMGTAIKIDRPLKWKSWQSPLRLVTIGMVGCIAVASLLGYAFFNLGVASALLLGAVLAPTDPVLASDVQVGPPNENIKFETKFALTAEAGMNDSLAFPFVLLAIAICHMGGSADVNLWEWLGYNVILRMVVGLAVGFLIGKLLGYILFTMSDKFNVLETRDGFVALSLTLMVYGIAELLHGYGFVAVFVAGLTLRNYEVGHNYHDKLHAFTDQSERIMLAIVLILFGGSLLSGVLSGLTWPMVMFSLMFLLLVRPITSYLSLASCNQVHSTEKWVISFFGIRGMGSVFYLAYAFKEAKFPHADELWTIVMFTILLSILLHGLTATRVMKYMEARFAKEIK